MRYLRIPQNAERDYTLGSVKWVKEGPKKGTSTVHEGYIKG